MEENIQYLIVGAAAMLPLIIIVGSFIYLLKWSADYHRREMSYKSTARPDWSKTWKKSWSPFDPLIPLYHDKGEFPCGGIAFSSHGKLKTGEIMESARVIYPDGKHPVHGLQIVCGNCEKPLIGAPTLNLSYHDEDTPCQ